MPRRVLPLTPLQIRNAKPKAKDYKLTDGGGLYLFVAKGGGKLWRLKYRFGGREKLLSLGVYPQISLADARQKREEAKGIVAKGIDPGEVRKEQQADTQRESETFEEVAREWHSKFISQWEPVTAKKILEMFERDVFGDFGNTPFVEINTPVLLAMLRRIEARGAIYSAHRVRGLCSQVFKYAKSTGRCENNPAADLQAALTPVKTTNRPATTDPKELAPLLRMLDSYQGSVVVCCALRLLPMLFVRPGELRAMKWADIDLERGEWSYVVTKTKTPHIVPLAKQALAVLREIKPVTDQSGFVFPSARSMKSPMSDMAINAAMRRMGIDTRTEITGHGFRAVARTILDEVLGFRPDFIEHQLAHAVRDPNGWAYNRTAHLDERKKMMQAWADYLDAIKEGAEIIPIRTAR
ncbi:MAG: integrase arm-type DNA-binding domain-containing protein [Proteobacteria bacterium]|nr:integrase arm-type DNA-binding domain-containing protein [Pseudomonadota bacterium]MBU1687854.1 integrase arm-type DNA-binding domain-containing protein [Pseudomonadota bacterium]